MGTSKSSDGPASGVSLVPPWVGDIPPDDDSNAASAGDPSAGLQEAVAQTARFRDARRSLGKFAEGGNTRDLRRALAHYVSHGYGGSSSLSRRLSGTAAAAGRLDRVLDTEHSREGTEVRDHFLQSGSNADEVMDALVDAVRPIDGSQDAESARRSIREALSDLLDIYPDADLLNLDKAQRDFVIERFTALDIYGRLCLDLEKSVMAKTDVLTALNRLAEIRDFIVQSVSSAFRKVRASLSSTTSASIARITKLVLSETFAVFEEYT